MLVGNALIGQSGGPTSVINASLYGAVNAWIRTAGNKKIYGMRYGIEGFLDGHVVDLGAEDRGQLRKLLETPSSALGSCRYKLEENDLEKVLTLLEKLDIRYYYMIGGNDTMDTIYRIESYCRAQGYELYGVGIPKTVDNDLFGTDFTPGYPSAARYVALSVAQSGLLAKDMQKVDRFVVHQTVGRDSGWLAASSRLARHGEEDAPHLILLPERPIHREDFIEKVKYIINSLGWAYVVVGEGALWADGTPISAASSIDGFANIEFGAMSGSSAAVNLHALISGETGYRGEFQITESLPMCADDRVSRRDREMARACGEEAVRLSTRGETGVMVSIVRGEGTSPEFSLGTSPLDVVAKRTKPMPDSFIAPTGTDLSRGFIDYLTPLIDPMPEYARLRLREIPV